MYITCAMAHNGPAMISVQLDRFPADEKKAFSALCQQHGLADTLFFVFATIPLANPHGSLAKRRVFVVHTPTDRIHEYDTGATASWLAAVDMDIRNGFFPKAIPTA